MHLTTSDQLAPVVSQVLSELHAIIGTILPGVCIHHIGATAIPDALTKGDLDVLLRVNRNQFTAAIDRLRSRFSVKQPENWNSDFASFGSDTEFAVPVGIQLVVENSEADFFLFLRDHLLTHPEKLAEYNRLKLAHSERGMEDYRQAKNDFFKSLLALRRDRIGND